MVGALKAISDLSSITSLASLTTLTPSAPASLLPKDPPSSPRFFKSWKDWIRKRDCADRIKDQLTTLLTTLKGNHVPPGDLKEAFAKSSSVFPIGSSILKAKPSSSTTSQQSEESGWKKILEIPGNSDWSSYLHPRLHSLFTDASSVPGVSFAFGASDRRFSTLTLSNKEAWETYLSSLVAGIPEWGADPGTHDVYTTLNGQLLMFERVLVFWPFNTPFPFPAALSSPSSTSPLPTRTHFVSANSLARVSLSIRNFFANLHSGSSAPSSFLYLPAQQQVLVKRLEHLRESYQRQIPRSLSRKAQRAARDDYRSLAKAVNALLDLHSGVPVSISTSLKDGEQLALTRSYKSDVQFLNNVLDVSLGAVIPIAGADVELMRMDWSTGNHTNHWTEPASQPLSTLSSINSTKSALVAETIALTQLSSHPTGFHLPHISSLSPLLDLSEHQRMAARKIVGLTAHDPDEPPLGPMPSPTTPLHGVAAFSQASVFDLYTCEARVRFAIDTKPLKWEKKTAERKLTYNKYLALDLLSSHVRKVPAIDARTTTVHWGNAEWKCKDPVDGSAAPSGHIGLARSLSRRVRVFFTEEYHSSQKHAKCGRSMPVTIPLTPDDVLNAGRFWCVEPDCPLKHPKLTPFMASKGFTHPTLVPTTFTQTEVVENAVLKGVKKPSKIPSRAPAASADTPELNREPADEVAAKHNHHIDLSSHVLLHRGRRHCPSCDEVVHRDGNGARNMPQKNAYSAVLGRTRLGIYSGSARKGREFRGMGWRGTANKPRLR